MNQVRVEIDLNSVRDDGTTRVRLARADGRMERGQIVTAYESEDGVAAIAYVDRVDEVSGYAFITVNRSSLQDDDGTVGALTISSSNVNRAVAQLSNQRARQASSGAKVQQKALRRATSL
ncbi:hypothetical protein HUN59_14645 [Curtobacterium sp. Csp2]|uniref:hypothetical protein n=1 Tax=Curtobacterium sp. Csp2 TaxID=2495430 RepID=UPI00157FE537|nr:hypothetical protein [Curtobacterium sp. Csp2]QKS17279.1 hypothetical protein HUN59_14645 [Curtobacterium sp. Csp2]